MPLAAFLLGRSHAAPPTRVDSVDLAKSRIARQRQRALVEEFGGPESVEEGDDEGTDRLIGNDRGEAASGGVAGDSAHLPGTATDGSTRVAGATEAGSVSSASNRRLIEAEDLQSVTATDCALTTRDGILVTLAGSSTRDETGLDGEVADEADGHLKSEATSEAGTPKSNALADVAALRIDSVILSKERLSAAKARNRSGLSRQATPGHEGNQDADDGILAQELGGDDGQAAIGGQVSHHWEPHTGLLQPPPALRSSSGHSGTLPGIDVGRTSWQGVNGPRPTVKFRTRRGSTGTVSDTLAGGFAIPEDQTAKPTQHRLSAELPASCRRGTTQSAPPIHRGSPAESPRGANHSPISAGYSSAGGKNKLKKQTSDASSLLRFLKQTFSFNDSPSRQPEPNHHGSHQAETDTALVEAHAVSPPAASGRSSGSGGGTTSNMAELRVKRASAPSGGSDNESEKGAMAAFFSKLSFGKRRLSYDEGHQTGPSSHWHAGGGSHAPALHVDTIQEHGSVDTATSP